MKSTFLYLTGCLLLAGTGLLAGCSDSDDGLLSNSDAKHQFVRSSLTRDTQPELPAGGLGTLAAGNHAFAVDLYTQLDTDDANFMMSPVSIRMAFALLQGGARGATEAEIAAVMRYNLEGDSLHASFNALDLALAARNVAGDADNDPVELRVANSFWGLDGFPWKQDYLDLIAKNYGAGIETLDFRNAPEQSRNVINEWVETHTRERIKDLLPEGAITPLVTVAVLVNALYFKAPWALQFNSHATADAGFTRLDGSVIQAGFMNQTETFSHGDGAGYQALEMAFRSDDLSMVLVLPDAGTFDQFEDNLDANALDQILSGLKTGYGTIAIPKFEFKAGFQLKDVLIKLGMTTAFDSADLSGIVENKRLFIDDVYHKTFIAVDEDGAEAAASTAITVGVESAIIGEDFSFTADRPFLFLIRDRITGTILFLGRVTDPTA